MSSPFPSGLDWADGLNGRLGTPSGNGKQFKADAGSNAFEEASSSPELERGDYATFRHDFRTTWDNAVVLINTFQRGIIQADSAGNQTKILSASVRKTKGDQAIVSHTSEGWQPLDDEGLHIADLPPDECRVTPVTLNPELYKHPRFGLLVNFNVDSVTGGKVDTDFPYGPELIQRAEQIARSSQVETVQEIELLTEGIPDQDVVDLFNELVDLLRRGVRTFYLAGWKVSWTQYFFHMPINFIPGGFIQDPTEGGLPPLFWSDDETPTGNNTLEYAAAISNPNFYADGMSWLREADDAHFQRSRFAITRNWIGGPLGYWEPKLYDAAEPIPS